jgi:phage anti-repressor protein
MGKKYWRCPVIVRALYLAAEIETDIYTWIKDCIREHGFKEGYDYYRSGSEQMGPLEYNLPQSSIVEYGLEFWAAYDIANIMEGRQKELALKFLNVTLATSQSRYRSDLIREKNRKYIFALTSLSQKRPHNYIELLKALNGGVKRKP